MGKYNGELDARFYAIAAVVALPCFIIGVLLVERPHDWGLAGMFIGIMAGVFGMLVATVDGILRGFIKLEGSK